MSLFTKTKKIKLLLKKLEEKNFSVNNCSIDEMLQIQAEIEEIQAYKITANCGNMEIMFKFNDFFSRMKQEILIKNKHLEKKTN